MRFASVFFLALIFLGVSSGKSAGVDDGSEAASSLPQLTWCINHFPRWHEFPDNGEPFGPSVDFMQEVAKRAGFELVISENTPIARCLRMMQLGQVDLMSNLNYSTEREEFMRMIPIVEDDPESFWLRCNSAFANDPNSQLENMRLITLRGSSRKPGVADVLNNLSRPILMTESWEKAFEMVRLGRADAVIAPTASAYSVVEADRRFQRALCPVVFEHDAATPDLIHLGFSRRSEHGHLYPKIKTAVDSMRDDGLLDRLFPRLMP